MRTPKRPNDPNSGKGSGPRRGPICPSPRRKPEPFERIVCLDNHLNIWGWPSRGGIIVLEHVNGLDFEFLGLDPVDPPMQRDPDQDAEDAFCQRLLLLGAKWFDSNQRHGFVAGVAADDDLAICALEAGQQPQLSLRERRWVSVAYPEPAGPEGGFWVAEFDTPTYGNHERHNLVPAEASLVHLARSMAEKCELLKRIGARYYTSLDVYDGAASLNAWKEKTVGEFGPLVQTTYGQLEYHRRQQTVSHVNDYCDEV
ncbi:hypothetical protein N8I77_010468 [Diaporthe amygdali]|uniref:Uncharacterized protein n=1 Tax=Phomopsis amygdali TaxID=1214568 RepID=A0AAD9S793_PHOAM|nr:hypothetical protein N8I77_010468 [Diaporthe amygdali]